MQSVVGNDPIKTLGETGFAIRPCRLCTTAASRWAGRWGTSASALLVRPAVSVPPPFLCLHCIHTFQSVDAGWSSMQLWHR